MLKLRYAPPNIANFCLHSSTTEKNCPFTESDKHLLSKAMIGRRLIVITREALVKETHIHKSTIFCKSVVGIKARQLCPFQYANLCLHESTRDKSLMQICKG